MPNITKKLGSWRGIHRLVILGCTLATLFCIATFSKPSSFKSLLISYDGGPSCAFPPLSPHPTSQLAKSLGTVIQEIHQELHQMQQDHEASHHTSKHASFLSDILGFIESVHNSLSNEIPPDQEYQSHPPTNPTSNKAPSINTTNLIEEHFLTEEIRKYIRIKPNRLGKQNFMGANATFTSIGHACFAMKNELEQYMDYDIGDFCNDDWRLAQKLMVHGCDPLPRRRCFSKAPQFYTKPLPIDESLWTIPADRNVRWSQYRCKSFACLNAKNLKKKGFFKCSDCFDLSGHEFPRWIEPVYQDPNTNVTSDFTITEVLDLKPGEIRNGLDFSVGTGTFAARMREHNVTVLTATINLGAPFNEMIALRGLIPLYLTVNQRLPFFDNTLDLIHTTRFLDGWIDLVLLDFVLYDWDRVLRPGGILWIDSFFCLKEDLNDYLEVFGMLRYRKHKWIVVPKWDRNDGRELFFSAVLEKPQRPFR